MFWSKSGTNTTEFAALEDETESTDEATELIENELSLELIAEELKPGLELGIELELGVGVELELELELDIVLARELESAGTDESDLLLRLTATNTEEVTLDVALLAGALESGTDGLGILIALLGNATANELLVSELLMLELTLTADDESAADDAIDEGATGCPPDSPPPPPPHAVSNSAKLLNKPIEDKTRIEYTPCNSILKKMHTLVWIKIIQPEMNMQWE